MNLLNTYRHIANNGEKYHESRCYFEVGVDDNEIKWFLHDTQKNSRINVAPMFHRDILSVINSINIEDEDIDAFDHCLVIQKPNLDVASSTKKTGVHTHLVFLSLVYKEGKATWVLDAYASGRFKSYYLLPEANSSLCFKLIRGISEEVKGISLKGLGNKQAQRTPLLSLVNNNIH
jgi:hypothetical protein